MKNCTPLRFVVGLALAALGSSPALGQVLYSQNFEANDQAALWTVTDGPTDETADFFFDYSTVGVPSAPGSGGTTRGMKLQANMTDGVFGGFSVSPNGQSFTGDYTVSFDAWTNYLGADPAGVSPIGTTTGSTMLSMYGIQTAGSVANYPGVSDAIFFANTGDASGTGFRAYSSERVISYQLPHLNPEVDIDALGEPIDSHATYLAGTRSNNPASTTAPAGQLYLDTFPSVTVPAAQTALFPETQHGETQPGSFGFDWHAVQIIKSGTLVTWKVNGVDLITVETANFVTPTSGTNILFGHSDVNAGISTDPYYALVSFNLIDNIVVTQNAAPTGDADFDGDGDVDGADFLTWQRGLGLTGTTNEFGDATGDGAVDGADLAVWTDQFPAAVVAAAGSVPEPATLTFAMAAALVLAAAGRRRAA